MLSAPEATYARKQITSIDLKTQLINFENDLNHLSQLQLLNDVLFVVALCWILLVIVENRAHWSLRKWDGLTLIIGFLICCLGIFGLFRLYAAPHFEEANSATLDLRIHILICLMIAAPVIFYVAYWCNLIEISKGMHTRHLLSRIALGIALLVAVIDLILGIAILFTPDVSSFSS